MRTAPFEYHRAQDLDDALEWLARDRERDVKVLAGGHSLLPLMKLKLATPTVLLDVQDVSELKGVTVERDTVRIGALTRYVDLTRDPTVGEFLPLLSRVAVTVADIQVRNRGTIGGSLCHADPAADIPAAVLALDGRLVLIGPRGERRVKLDEFTVAPFLTSIEPTEILAAIEFPMPTKSEAGVYLKRPHPASGYPVVGVAITGTAPANTSLSHVRVAVTGVGPRAYRAYETEEMLEGQAPSQELFRTAADVAITEADLSNEADLAYREHLTRVYVERALHQFSGGVA